MLSGWFVYNAVGVTTGLIVLGVAVVEVVDRVGENVTIGTLVGNRLFLWEGLGDGLLVGRFFSFLTAAIPICILRSADAVTSKK